MARMPPAEAEAVQRERKIKSYKGGEALKKLLLKSSASR